MKEGAPKLAVITTVHNRAMIWELWLNHYRIALSSISGEMDITVYVAGDDQSLKRASEKHLNDVGVQLIWVEVPNSPLTFKWNKALRHAMNDKHDVYCFVDSDDLMSEKFIKVGTESFVNKDCDVIGAHEAPVLKVDFEKPEFLPQNCVLQKIDLYSYNSTTIPLLGSGRFYSHDILERMGKSIYKGSMNKGIDQSMDTLTFSALNGKPIFLIEMNLEVGTWICILKHGQNLNNWEHFSHLPLLEPTSEVKQYWRDLIALAKASFKG